MKTRTETNVVPEETYTRTIFGCDFCDFEDDDEERVKNHHAKTHASKKTMDLGGVTFHWFDAKEDAELWIDPPGDYSSHDFTYVEWSEPGWYGSETEHGTGRCRCGGCSYFESTLRPLHSFVERWKKEVESHEKSIKERLALIEEAQKFTPTQENQS